MNIILIANAISLLGALIMVGTGFIRKKETVLNAQCLQFAVMGIGNLLLGGMTGFVTNLVGIARNVWRARRDYTLAVKLVFIAAHTVPSLVFNTQGLLGLLPLIAACVFTCFLDTKSDTVFKMVVICTSMLWVIYDYSLCNYVSCCFDVLTITSNSFGLYLLRRKPVIA